MIPLRSFTSAHRGGTGPPLVCLHGFMDTWRTWELVLPILERHHDVLAPTLPGHAGGPSLEDAVGLGGLADATEVAMDEAGFASAHIVGNSLGGRVALELATRGRARSVVALAPAGGWADGDESFHDVVEYQRTMREMLNTVALYADALASTTAGRRRATQAIVSRFDHIPADLVAHQICAAASCEASRAMLDHAVRERWDLDGAAVTCPVRIVWGTEDKLLRWPAAAARFRRWLPQADWVELDGVGHCPQLDVPLETAHLIIGFTTV